MLFGIAMMIMMFVGIQNGSSITQNMIMSCIFSILCFSFAAYSFRIGLALREQVKKYAGLNIQFKKENAELSANVDNLNRARAELGGVQSSLAASNKRMGENISKFRSLQENLNKFAGGNIEGMEELQKQAEKMKGSWQDSLIKNEKSIFHKIFEELEMKDDQEDMSREEFEGFLKALPEDYSALFATKSWEKMAGEDGIMQFEEFKDVVDEIVEERVNQKWKEEE